MTSRVPSNGGIPQPGPINFLDEDLTLNIFRSFTPVELDATIRLVCRAWNRLASNPSLQRERSQSDHTPYSISQSLVWGQRLGALLGYGERMSSEPSPAPRPSVTSQDYVLVNADDVMTQIRAQMDRHAEESSGFPSAISVATDLFLRAVTGRQLMVVDGFSPSGLIITPLPDVPIPPPSFDVRPSPLSSTGRSAERTPPAGQRTPQRSPAGAPSRRTLAEAMAEIQQGARRNPFLAPVSFMARASDPVPLSDDELAPEGSDSDDDLLGITGIAIVGSFGPPQPSAGPRTLSRFREDMRERGVARRLFDDDEDSADEAIVQSFAGSLAASDQKREGAVKMNQDGGTYLATVISEELALLAELSLEDKVAFKEKLASCEPEIFFTIPRLAVEKLIYSKNPLTKNNTPRFMHTYLAALEELRLERMDEAALTEEKVKTIHNKIGAIVTALARKKSCIASIQNALRNC